jgi:TonB family protein
MLVTDFVSPEGFVSPYGRHLADELAAEIKRQNNLVHLVKRSLLKGPLGKLQEERVPADIRHSAFTARWIGDELNASVVLIGEIEDRKTHGVSISAQLLHVAEPKHDGASLEFTLPLPSSLDDLSATDPLPPLPNFPDTVNGERIYRAGANGVGSPNCHFMPSPPYTDEARKAGLSGSLVIEGVVYRDGSVKDLRVVRGLMFGLNDSALRMMATWKCDPVSFNGEPVSVYVPFEVTFRVYKSP